MVFYNYRFSLPENEPIREILAKGQNRNDFRNAIIQLKEKYLLHHLGHLPWDNNQNGKIINCCTNYIPNITIIIMFRF